MDILLGAWLLRYSQAALRRAHAFAALIVGMLAATLTARAGVLEPERLSSGVFRYGQRDASRTSRSSTIATARRLRSPCAAPRTTRSASSPTASRTPHPDGPGRPPTGDEYTMVIAGALPLLVKPEAKTLRQHRLRLRPHRRGAAVAQRPAGDRHHRNRAGDGVRRARLSPRASIRPYRDPRSNIHIEDAKSFFARHGKRYDVIISEPSNPWVNGVASLFTDRVLPRHRSATSRRAACWCSGCNSTSSTTGCWAPSWPRWARTSRTTRCYETNGIDLIVVAVAEGRVPRLGPLPVKETVFMEQSRASRHHAIGGDSPR